MKTELLATLATLTDQINALPDDPPPPMPPAPPTNFVIVNEDGVNPHVVRFGWDNPGDGNTFRFQYKGAPGNAAGPSEWTDIPTNAPDQFNVSGGVVIQNPDGQSLLFQLFVHDVTTGLDSAPATLSWP